MFTKQLALTTAIISAATLAVAEMYPEPISFLESEGAKIVGTFDAPGGLKGYAASFRGEILGVYLTPDGKHAIVGNLLDGKGDMVATKYLAQLETKAAGPAKIDWTALDKSDWIAEGDKDSERIVYAFTDPNCPYCAMFWEKAQPYLEKGGAQLRHIMVGVLHPTSLSKAATILDADDPAAALAKHERTLQQGGMFPDKDVPEKTIQKVLANSQLMHDNNIFATPAIVYKDSEGVVRQVQGMPSDEAMKDIFAISR